MRDIVVLAIVLGGLPFCVLRPYWGVLLWVWLTYMNPHRLTWGVAHDFPVAMLVGGATLFGVFLAKLRGELGRLPSEREMVLLGILWLLFTISSVFALDPETSWPRWEQTTKVLCLAFIIPMVCDDRRKLTYLLYVMVFSVGFYGVKGGIFAFATGFEHRVWGPEGSFLADNNDVAMCLNISLPILFFLARYEANWKIRTALLFTFWFSIPAIIATYSRGGFLTMAAVLFMLLTRSSKKLLLVLPLAIGVLVVLPLLPEKYFDRIESIEEASQKDGSAIERLNAWRFNFNLAMARPLTGGGFEPIRADVWEQYAPEFKHKPTSAHSVYFQVLGDHGFLALGVYLLVFGLAILSCRTTQARAGRIPSYTWLADYARMMEISLIAFLIAGTFYNRAYVDIAFHLICTVIILKVLARAEFAKATTSHQAQSLEQSPWDQVQTALSARTS